MAKKAEKIKGYIFDFNGTMFFDGAKHDEAWRSYLENRIGRKIPKEELMEYVYGRPNTEILGHFLGGGLSREEVRLAAGEKEACYRELCLSDPAKLHLAAGLPDFLDRLQEGGYPMAIASAANRDNMDFYFDVFGLERWFPWERVVYDDGTLKGKPAPDYFLEAFQRLHLPPEACHVFEDSLSGVLAAHCAGAGMITAVYGDSQYAMLQKQQLADSYIMDFSSLRASSVD